MDAPISVRNRRRDAGSFQSGVRFGNSSSTKARNSSVDASSSKLRQYFGLSAFICLPVTRHAIRQLLDLVLGDQPIPELQLIVRSLVGHAEHLILRSDVLFRLAMALHAPLH